LYEDCELLECQLKWYGCCAGTRFQAAGNPIEEEDWYQNMKIKLIVLAIIIALILIIVLSVCHGFGC